MPSYAESLFSGKTQSPFGAAPKVGDQLGIGKGGVMTPAQQQQFATTVEQINPQQKTPVVPSVTPSITPNTQAEDPNARLEAYLAQSKQEQPKSAMGMIGSALGSVGRGIADIALQPARFIEQAGKGIGIKASELVQGRKFTDEELNKINNFGGKGLQESVAEKIAPSVASQYNTDAYKTTGEAVGGAIQAAANLATPFVGGAPKTAIQSGALSFGGALERGESLGDSTTQGLIGAGTGFALSKASDFIGDKLSKVGTSKAASTVGSKAKGIVGKVKDKVMPEKTPIAAAQRIAERRGVDKRATQLIAESAKNPSELQYLSKMQKIAKEASETATPTTRPEEVIGEVINKKVDTLAKLRKTAGATADSAFKKIPNKPIDITEQAQRFASELGELGVIVKPNGKLDFRRSAFGGPSGGKTRALFEDAWRDVAPNAKGQSIRMPARLKATRQKLFRALDLDKQGEAFTSQDKAIVERLRSALDEPLKNASPEYAKASKEYAQLTSVLSDFYSTLGKKFVGADDAILNIRSGEIANRLLSNSSANVERVINALDGALPTPARVKSPDLKRLVAFNQMMQDLYGVTPLTSLQGRMERGAQNVIEGVDVAGKLIRKDVTGLVETGAKKVLGITPEKQRTAIENLITAHGLPRPKAIEIVDAVGAMDMPPVQKNKLLDNIPELTGILTGVIMNNKGQEQSPQLNSQPMEDNDPNARLMKEIERLKAAQ